MPNALYARTIAVPHASSQNSQMNSVLGIRKYGETSDHPHVVEICKNVYGGTDQLPNFINTEAARHDTAIYVATDVETDTLHGLICTQARGSALWVYGARIRETWQRQGLAKKLLAHVESIASSSTQQKNIVLMSCTILANVAMLQIFKQHGYVQQCQIDILTLPADSNTSAHAENENEGAAEASSSSWRLCSSQSELEEALLKLRRRRQRRMFVQHDTDVLKLLFSWIPGEYSCFPSFCDQTATFIAEKQIWMLNNNNNSITASKLDDDGDDGVCAVLFLDRGAFQSYFAGIVSSSWNATEMAVKKARELHPCCVRYYIDSCDSLQHEEQLATLGGEIHDFIVVHKFN